MVDPDTQAALQAELDRAVHAVARPHLAPGEIPVSWVLLIATRHPDGGGHVIHVPSDGVMPVWEARGIITEALAGTGYPPDEPP